MGRSRTSVGRRTLLGKTCNNCKKFKDRSEFRQMQTGVYAGYWTAWCYECNQAASRVWKKKSNDAAISRAAKRWVRWDQAERKKLAQMCKDGASTQEIADELGRSRSSIEMAKLKFL